MPSTPDYADYVCDQIRGCGFIRYKKMFGEYMIYVDEKPILLVCDNIVFVKITKETTVLLQEAEIGFPYNGAREHYILDIDNRELSLEVVETLKTITSIPKKKIKIKK